MRSTWPPHTLCELAWCARVGAPRLERLSKKDLRPNGVTIRTIFGRLAKAGDLWKDFGRRAGSLKTARRKLEDLHGT